MNKIVEDDRIKALEAFANTAAPAASLVPATPFAAPTERIFGAQTLAVYRDDEMVLRKLRVMAAAAGDDFYYRIPVKKKIKNDDTGKDEWTTDYIEGPSIKCANAVARVFGNCDVDTRVVDAGSHWVFYSRFIDLETGYSLTRPFQQRKNQASMRGDSGRQEDIAFQIGTSKAIRNVINNALEFYTSFAATEAKRSIVEKVGLKLDFYKQKVAERLEELEIDVRRVEHVRGRALKDWLAADVAKTIAEIQAISDGMANAEETYPIPGKKENVDSETGEVLSEFAKDTTKGAPTADGADTNKDTPAADKQQAQGSQPDASSPHGPAGATEGAEAGNGYASDASAPSSNASTGPANDAAYKAYAAAWIAEQTDPEECRARWSREKGMRNKANVSPETRDELEGLVKAKVSELKKKS
jgi:hypothetical protein